jgi:ubiquitin carboxyl-terminal hydrolase 4/11/15
LTQAPNILILHLKRFKTTRVYSSGSYFFHGGSQKITSFIDYPITSFDINDLVLCRKKVTSIRYL